MYTAPAYNSLSAKPKYAVSKTISISYLPPSISGRAERKSQQLFTMSAEGALRVQSAGFSTTALIFWRLDPGLLDFWRWQ